MKRRNLRRLLAWPEERPDVAVVLVDEDGEVNRLETLEKHLDPDWVPPIAIGVAVREFEAWLISDMRAVRDVLASRIDEPSDPSRMRPGEAKSLLDHWVERSGQTGSGGLVRRRIAEELEFPTASRVSPSLQRFLEFLGSALARVP